MNTIIIKSSSMIYLADITLWSRAKDNNKITVVQTRCLRDVNISHSFDNIMDGKYYHRGSIEKDGNRQINRETINTRKLQYREHLTTYNS